MVTKGKDFLPPAIPTIQLPLNPYFDRAPYSPKHILTSGASGIFQADGWFMIAFLTSSDALWAYAVLSAIISCIAFVPYISDTIAGRTQPQRASWLIWSTLSSIALASQIAEGAVQSLAFAAIQCGGTILIFLLSVHRGAGGYLNRRDGFVLLAAATGLGLWYLTNSAVYALGISITISLLGGLCTITKAYCDPGSETLSCWMLGLIASAFAVMSVGQLDWVLLAYPLYLVTLYSGIVAATLLGRNQIEKMAIQPLEAIRPRPRKAAHRAVTKPAIAPVYSDAA